MFAISGFWLFLYLQNGKTTCCNDAHVFLLASQVIVVVGIIAAVLAVPGFGTIAILFMDKLFHQLIW